MARTRRSLHAPSVCSHMWRHAYTPPRPPLSHARTHTYSASTAPAHLCCRLPRLHIHLKAVLAHKAVILTWAVCARLQVTTSARCTRRLFVTAAWTSTTGTRRARTASVSASASSKTTTWTGALLRALVLLLNVCVCVVQGVRADVSSLYQRAELDSVCAAAGWTCHGAVKSQVAVLPVQYWADSRAIAVLNSTPPALLPEMLSHRLAQSHNASA